MANCRYCGTNCPENGEHDRFFDCQLYTDRRPTNADRIRSMSNMELAEMLVRYDSNLYGYYCPDGSFCDDEDSALSFALDWLDKPVKEELT